MKSIVTRATRSVLAWVVVGAMTVALALPLGLTVFSDYVYARPLEVSCQLPGASAPDVKLTCDDEQKLEAAATYKDATPIAPAAKTYTSTTRSSSSTSTKASSGSELAQAQSILAGLISRYPILAGSTVTFGDAKGYQAICYYKSGRIVIATNHTRSLSTILNHEVWHIIDWRDNGRIDWGERVPPS